jgi:AraC-like DNA-binding protein
MRFRQVRLASDLSPYVAGGWTLQGSASCVPERILPDGRMELIFHFGEPFRRYRGQEVEVQSRLLLAGQMKSPVLVQPNGGVDVLGVTIHTHTAANILQLPAEAVAETLADPAEVSKSLAREFEAVLEAAPGERLTAVQTALRRRIQRRPDIDATVAAAVRSIQSGAGARPVRQIAAVIGISERHLQRIFSIHVGLSPKQYSRIVRFQTTLRALRDAAGLGALAIALDRGYYDQAHFVHEFRQMAGVPPVALLERMEYLTRAFARSRSHFYKTG